MVDPLELPLREETAELLGAEFPATSVQSYPKSSRRDSDEIEPPSLALTWSTPMESGVSGTSKTSSVVYGRMSLS